jgi:predicted CXXCH cytochrome family protein
MTSGQCAGCHATEAGLSHPVKVTPTMAVPADWPLEGGQVNCTTCHVDTFAAHTQAGGALLRDGGTGGAAFCAQCHTRTSISRQGQHPFAITKAHLLSPAGVNAVADAAASAGRGDGVDNCLACHDGAVAPDAYGGLGAGGGVGSAGSHPVGVAYPSTSLRVGDAPYKAASVIDRRVRLTNGRVTCNACHSLYSPLPRLMVMRNDRSVLCLACHAQ